MKKTIALILISAASLLAQGSAVTLTQSAAPPVQSVSASYQGVAAGTPIYYWVIARYPGGYSVPVGPAVTYNTVGANNLSAANRVFVSWTFMPSATGYDVLHAQTPVFPANPGCTDCAVVKNTALNSVTDTNASNLFYPDPGMNGSQAITAVITIDNLTRAYPYYQSNINGAMAALALIYGVPVTGRCAMFDALGRIVDAGAICNSGAATWGAITGVLAAQTDLAKALAAKQADMGITGQVGNTHNFQAAGAGAPANNDCAKYDANANIITAGGPCGGLPAMGGNAGKFLQTDGGTAGWNFPILTDVYASIPAAAAGNTGQLFKPTDGLGIYRSTGAAWAGYGPMWPTAPPPTAGWSWDNQVGATAVTVVGDTLSEYCVTSANQLQVYYRAAPAAPYTLTVMLRGIINPNTFANVTSFGVVFRQAGTGKLIAQSVTMTPGLVVNKWTNSTTWSADYTLANNATVYAYWSANPLWLRMADDNTNLTWSFSLDGVNFKQFDQRLRGDFMVGGPDQVGIACQAAVPIGEIIYSWTIT